MDFGEFMSTAIVIITAVVFAVVIVGFKIDRAVTEREAEKKRRADQQMISLHLRQRDYLWILENCGNSKFCESDFEYAWSPEITLTPYEMLARMGDITLFKGLQLAYRHGIITVNRLWKGERCISSEHGGVLELFDMEVEGQADVALKYVLYRVIEVAPPARRPDHLQRRQQIYERIKTVIKEKFADKRAFESELEKACGTFKRLFGLGELILEWRTDEIEIFGQNPPEIQRERSGITLERCDDSDDEGSESRNGSLGEAAAPISEAYQAAYSGVINESGNLQARIRGHIVEFDALLHRYLVDGKRVSSASEIVNASSANGRSSRSFGGTAAHRANLVRDAIKAYEEDEGSSFYVIRGYLELKKRENFQCVATDRVVLYCDRRDEPLFCGKIDLVLSMNGKRGISLIRTASRLDYGKVKLQLNMYRAAYEQSYNEKVDFLKVAYIRDERAALIDVDIDDGIDVTVSERIAVIDDDMPF